MKKVFVFILFVLITSCTTLQEFTKPPSVTDGALFETATNKITDAGFETLNISKNCPDEMVEIDGEYCSNLELICLHYLDKAICNKYDPNDNTKCLPGQLREPARCQTYRRPSICKGTTKKVHYCIDRYEASNKKGDIPPVMQSWYDGKRLCEAQGKRLCMDYEWTVACEGPSKKPYPYGWDRDKTACNIDKPQRVGFDASKVRKFTPEMIAWLDQRVPSGSMPRCVSDYGVYDMTGNVDEATINESGTPSKNSLKGGHWVQGARNRCQPETTQHPESFANYESSWRCCMNIPALGDK